MKRILMVVLAVLLAAPSWAGDVGSCTETMEIDQANSRIKVIKLTNCTASGTDLQWSVRNYAKVKGHMLMQVNTYPGGTAPTASSDLYIYDEAGGKIGDTQLENIITTTAQEKKLDSKPIIWGPFYIDVDNNSQAGAITTIWLFFYPL